MKEFCFIRKYINSMVPPNCYYIPVVIDFNISAISYFLAAIFCKAIKPKRLFQLKKKTHTANVKILYIFAIITPAVFRYWVSVSKNNHELFSDDVHQCWLKRSKSFY